MKFIGFLMFAAPFVALYIGFGLQESFKEATLLFLIVGFVVAWIAVGAYLMSN